MRIAAIFVGCPTLSVNHGHAQDAQDAQNGAAVFKECRSCQQETQQPRSPLGHS